MKRRDAAKLLALLACCLLLTACPPSGGNLAPLAQGAEGTQVITTERRDDTLRLTRQGVSVSGRGVWTVRDSGTSIILEINNATGKPVILDLERCELVNRESNQKLVLRSVSDETRGHGPAFISDRMIRIEGGQEKKLALEFKQEAADGGSSVSRNVSGQSITLRLPLMLRDAEPVQPEQDERPAQVDFVLSFKYAE